jgi:hypothetical protein
MWRFEENGRQIYRPSHWIRTKGPGRAIQTLRQRTIFERTTKANEDYKSQNAQLTKKLDNKRPIPLYY